MPSTSAPTEPPNNPFWDALTGAQAALAIGDGGARRFAPGLPPIVAFADPAEPDFDALQRVVGVGELLFTAGWSGALPAGWNIEVETTMLRMVWDAPLPEVPAEDPGLSVAALGPEHLPQVLALVDATRPGPFGPRTLELGDYLGCFDGPQLIAMAGERAFAAPWRELSGVCTAPAYQGRGLSRRLLMRLLRLQIERGEQPFLHVLRDNLGARALYERLGFRVHAEPRLRVFSRL
jgi:GNAT superfamily N-acetyltransferase